MSDLMFSVVTVSFNQGEFIRKNIESVLAQNWDNFEHIIIDAGSTDNTLEILKEYPHLKWTSEPDRGQSHGLNKGFARASGDVIVWLNSDDFLEPNIFADIAPILKEHDVVLGKAVETDRAGKPVEEVMNPPKTWMDLVKFWIPYAWLTQPSVFFTRKLLERVKLEDGVYVREDLFYTMDFDLWLRMAKLAPFGQYINKVCAYFPVYEDNKTGEDGEAVQREFGRGFKKHQNALINPERNFSFVVTVSEIDQALVQTINSIAEQTLQNNEIILAPHQSKLSESGLRKAARQLDAQFPALSIRSCPATSADLFSVYNESIDTIAGLYTVFLQAGEKLDRDFCLEANNTFVFDWAGVLIPVKNQQALHSSLTDGTGAGVTVSGILNSPIFSPTLAVRTLALRDLCGFKNVNNNMIAVRELLLRALSKSWHVIASNKLGLEAIGDFSSETKYYPIFQTHITAKLVSEHFDEYQFDKYAQLRMAQQTMIAFPQNVVENSKLLLSVAPPNWEQMDYLQDQNALQAIVESYPDFDPAKQLLSK